MTLTSEYQYIGRSEGLRNIGGGYHYYLLLYAKTAGSAVTGKHNVSLKVRLACDLDVYFYGFATTVYGKAAGQTVFSWNGQYQPAEPWQTQLTAGGITYPRWTELGEGTAQVYVGYGVGKEITLEAGFQRLSIPDAPDYLPIINACSVSCKVSLPALVSPSVPTVSASVAELGSALVIKTNRKSAALKHSISYEFGGKSGVIGENITDSVSWTPPLSLAEAIPAAVSAVATVYCQTYADGVALGEKVGVSVTLRVPDTEQTRPQVTLKLSPKGSLPAAFQGLYIQNLTALETNVSAVGRYGAAIRSYEVLVNGNVYTGGMLTATGTVTVTGRATDSRGFVGQTRQTVTVLPYSKPAILPAEGLPAILCGRCNEGGSFTESGDRLRIVARRSYAPLIHEGTQRNFCPIRYRIDGGAWQTLLEGSSTADAIDTGPMAVTLDTTKSYRIEVGVADTLGGSAVFTQTVPTDRVDIHLREGGGGLALGGYCTKAAFECNLPAYFTKAVQASNLLGRYVSDNYASVLHEAGKNCLGQGSNAGLLLMVDTAEPSRFALCYYHYVNNHHNTMHTLLSNKMQYVQNAVGTVAARDENGTAISDRTRYTVLPCFATA